MNIVRGVLFWLALVIVVCMVGYSFDVIFPVPTDSHP